MSTVFSHYVIGLGMYRFVDKGRDPWWTGPFVAGTLSMLPDADSLLMPWVAYGDPWGHRGMTHSLAFAVVAGALGALVIRRRVAFPGGFAGLAALLAAVTASHGVLDAMTDGGLGVAFFAPFDSTRYFLPVRPIPVCPITTDPTHPGVASVLAVEVLLLWPFALLLATARRDVPRWGRVTTWALATVGVVAWGARCFA
jgi:inner membrane protein